MPHRKNTPEDVWKRIRIGAANECWEWQGATNHEGYGQIRIACESRLVHRVVFELGNGSIPNGFDVCHTCDNPPCCNPSHLFAGTRSANVQDMYQKGRAVQAQPRGEAHGSAILTEEQVRSIRQERLAGAKLRELAHKYSVTIANVSAIVTHKSWRHLKWKEK